VGKWVGVNSQELRQELGGEAYFELLEADQNEREWMDR
jgi:hypothetical protein